MEKENSRTLNHLLNISTLYSIKSPSLSRLYLKKFVDYTNPNEEDKTILR
jgi:hypothetical protein